MTANETEILGKFKMFDTNGDGCITLDEVRQVIGSMGIEIPDDELQRWARKTDTSGNGCIEYHEFAHFIMEKKK